MTDKRPRFRRFTKRLEATFSTGGMKFRGISSDLSEGGLFIRTRNGLTPGTITDIEIFLSEGKTCRLKGIVRRTIKTSLSTIKNGMGIEILERDSNYLELLRGIETDTEVPDESFPPPPITGSREEKKTAAGSSLIIVCPACGAKNRVPAGKLPLGPKCGKCGETLYSGTD